MGGGRGGGRETWKRYTGRKGGDWERWERDVEEGGTEGRVFKVIQNAGKRGNEGENVRTVYEGEVNKEVKEVWSPEGRMGIKGSWRQ